ncbi:MFS transporter [Campylobacter pinnipediorum]|uniref:MFS transporter n=1 Tax=Campylobacter pinnipediorum TaxID=1965231 RepID=UPI001C5A7BE9|nr:MFS transporter [Campylobacter pinnipediorum]
MASIGLGAIVLPRLRKRFDSDKLIVLSAILSGIVMLGLSFAPPKFIAVIAVFFLASAWIIALTTLNSVTQTILPNWVRGRSLAIYITTFNGAMTAGSLIWGVVAQYIGISLTLVGAAILLVVANILASRKKLPLGEDDLNPAQHWEESYTHSKIDLHRSPVLVQVEYLVKKSDQEEFLHKIKKLAEHRKKDGAYAWGIVQSTHDEEILLEWFFVENWAEHLRQHNRVSKVDAMLQAEVNAYHQGEKPNIKHFVGMS